MKPNLVYAMPVNGSAMGNASPLYISNHQQQMSSSQLSYGSAYNINQRYQRSSLEDKHKVTQASIKSGINDVSKQLKKVRESSEQKVPNKVENLQQVQNKSQLIYGTSSSFSFMQPGAKKQPTAVNTFQEMNIRIQDVGPQLVIQEEPNEMNRNSALIGSKSPSPQKRDSNKEWSEILLKTKSLEENLLQLKNSINNNLKKIQRGKIDTNVRKNKDSLIEVQKSKNQRSENSLIIKEEKLDTSNYMSETQQNFKTQVKNKIQDTQDDQNRLSKESTQSKYSTKSITNNSVVHNNASIVFKNNLLQTDEKKVSKIKYMPVSQPGLNPKPIHTVPGLSQVLSHNPSLTQLNLGQHKSHQQTERLGYSQFSQNKKDLQLNTEIKTQNISRINSPLQSKILKKDNSTSKLPARNKSSEKKKDEIAATEIMNFSQSLTSFKVASVVNPLYLPVSPLKDRLQTGAFIGRGKFSDVFLAKDSLTGFHFALKIIRKEVIKEFQMEDQLAREIRSQSLLNHANIVKLYGAFYDDEKIYLALEYCQDGELFQLQYKQPDKKFSETQTATMISQILDAINYMHEKMIMHRDLKTENILLSYGQIKLCDLGCVCDFTPGMRFRTTFCGTVDYIAPEVITGGGLNPDNSLKGYDQRCDIWQVAILAYELTVGKTPFTDNGSRDEDAIMDNILKKEVKFPADISPELKNFITQGLQKDPEKRIKIKNMMLHPWILKYKNRDNMDLNSLLKK